MIATLYAILTAPVAFIATHPWLAFVGAAAELAAVVLALLLLRRRDALRADVESTEPTNPHPGRNCDQTCVASDDAHDGYVWMSWAAS